MERANALLLNEKKYSPLSPCSFVPWRWGLCLLHRPSKEVYSQTQAARFPERHPSGEALKTMNYSHAHANHHSLPVSPASSVADTPRRFSPKNPARSNCDSRFFERRFFN